MPILTYVLPIHHTIKAPDTKILQKLAQQLVKHGFVLTVHIWELT